MYHVGRGGVPSPTVFADYAVIHGQAWKPDPTIDQKNSTYCRTRE